nr:hypothetical protein [Chitinophaga dinghuensis]
MVSLLQVVVVKAMAVPTIITIAKAVLPAKKDSEQMKPTKYLKRNWEK